MSSTSIFSASTTATSTALPSGSISALIGNPPATEKDYWIVKYLLLAFHSDADPMLGIVVPPVRPNPYHYETRGPKILTSMIIAITVMIIVTGLRLGVRMFRRGLRMGWDDAFIIPGVLLALAWPSLQIAAVVYGGAGKHMYDVTYEEYGVFKTCTNLSKVVFFLSVGFIKVSICFFNRRLTSLTGRAWSIFNNVFLGLLTAYLIAALFMNIFQCLPAYGGWDAIRIGKEGVAAKCQSDSVFGSALSTIHVIMDFGLLSVPIIVLWKVKMSFGTKLRLYIVFGFGGMSAIGSIVRQVEQGRLNSDVLYTFVPLQDWTLVDLTFGVVAASLPILSAFIPQKWKSVTGSGPTKPYGYGYAGGDNSTQRAYIRSTRRTSITGKRERSDSEENIVRTDEVELTYQKRELKQDNGMLDNKEMNIEIVESNSPTASFGSDRRSRGPGNNSVRTPSSSVRVRHELEYGQDGVIADSSHQAWVGQAR
ncbi:hypothetical protein BP5796_10020 [Coleophoma crateriformis]|uniref:Rhodopsin domain-containing protein n=1 Tax=Coleophoma crateriformis TaxID=565419 RepID=A0A3D8QUG4_9HELO|nr:hypothetical protein BP5796_10020 [Coleophoma crateriformis]